MYNKQLVSEMIRASATEEGRALSQNIVNKLEPQHFELMASLRGIPDNLIPMYKSILEGDLTPFIEMTEDLTDWFQAGDIILMAGSSRASKLLIQSQKKLYKDTRSSHVALVKADFLGIDAMPKIGVTPRLITDILADAEDWRIIRFNGVDESHSNMIQQACTYYFLQPYMILPSRKPAKKFSYCSELARKVYQDINMRNTGIPKGPIIKPCDFDKLADHNKNWIDVSEQLMPAIDLCKSAAPVLRLFNEHYTNGLRLNRERFEDRKKTRIKIKQLAKSGKVSKSYADKTIAMLNETDKAMHNQFWDVSKLKK